MRKIEKTRKAKLKSMLVAMRDDITKRIFEEMGSKKDELSDDRNQAPMDSGDLSTLDFQQSMENTLLSHETEHLNRVNSALDRLKQGTYGVCLNCGKEINLVRLQAVPFVEYCVSCQGKKESAVATE